MEIFSMNRAYTLRAANKGRTIAIVGDVYRFLATGDETDGKYAIWEAIVPPGGGPPPHVHSREEEGFYILEGEITFHVGLEFCTFYLPVRSNLRRRGGALGRGFLSPAGAVTLALG